MSFMTIDMEQCNNDGICAAECPMKIIMMQDGVPTPVNGADKLCINCGHCVAVCPKSAFSLKSMAPDNCLSVNKEMLLGPEEAEHFLRQRRSIRTYKEKPVDRETLEKLIGIASHAPSGHNTQSVKWQIIYEREEVKRLSGMVIDWMKYMIKEQPDLAGMLHLDLVVEGWKYGMDIVSRDAQHLVLANADKVNTMGKNSCIIAMTHFELALPAFGLGGCWNGFFNTAAIHWPPLKEALGFGDDTVNHATMMVGFPKYRYHRMPTRNNPDITWG